MTVRIALAQVTSTDDVDANLGTADYHGAAPRGVGHSLVAGPDGRVLESLGENPDLLVIDLDLDGVDVVRRSLPVLANRRF